MPPFCERIENCGGCPWGIRPLEEQRESKIALLAGLSMDTGVTVEMLDTPALGLRDRVDLVWEDGRLGLYGAKSAAIVDLPDCPMLSPQLADFHRAYRERQPPLRKGSVRLRVSPAGERGVWLDFANRDVKALFEEREYLRWLSALAFVEVGQRRKALEWRNGAPKLTEPQLRPWFETYGARGQAIPLYGPVGGFSQAGFAVNRALVGEVASAAARSGVRDWVELFAGNGNFALALGARGLEVEALEIDPLAVAGMQLSLRDRPEWKVRSARADVYLKTRALPALSGRGLLVDPPRAGMRQTLERLAGPDRPRALIYVSCFTEVFAAEAARLLAMGYTLISLRAVDQFPHSPHVEWIALFTFAGA